MTLAHLTLNTGHLRMSPRAEVREEAIRSLDGLVRAGGGACPGFSTIAVQVKVDPGLAQIVISAAEAQGGGMLIGGALIWSEEVADEIWADMAVKMPTVERPKHLPQLLIALHDGIAAMPRETISMLGDLERCLAWAILAQEGLAP
jgi:hypothetical protein